MSVIHLEAFWIQPVWHTLSAYLWLWICNVAFIGIDFLALLSIILRLSQSGGISTSVSILLLFSSLGWLLPHCILANLKYCLWHPYEAGSPVLIQDSFTVPSKLEMMAWCGFYRLYDFEILWGSLICSVFYQYRGRYLYKVF